MPAVDKYELSKKAVHIRKLWGEDDTSPIDIFRLALTSLPKLTLVFYPMGDNISGMCVRRSEDTVIGINSGMSLGRQRFSMAHELYHHYYGEDTTTLCAKNIGTGQNEERNADQFASFFLIPPNGLVSALESLLSGKNALTVADVVALEQRFGVSRQAMLFRLVDEGVLSRPEAETMKSNVRLSALSCGYDDALYNPSPEGKQHATYGHYIRQAEELLGKELISEGKFEELLLGAFRPDRVYGMENEGGELFD